MRTEGHLAWTNGVNSRQDLAPVAAVPVIYRITNSQ